MKKIMWAVAAVAVVFLIVGGTVEAVGFLLWLAPVLLIVAAASPDTPWAYGGSASVGVAGCRLGQGLSLRFRSQPLG